jgi:hypothetical protein
LNEEVALELFDWEDFKVLDVLGMAVPELYSELFCAETWWR